MEIGGLGRRVVGGGGGLNYRTFDLESLSVDLLSQLSI